MSWSNLIKLDIRLSNLGRFAVSPAVDGGEADAEFAGEVFLRPAVQLPNLFQLRRGIVRCGHGILRSRFVTNIAHVITVTRGFLSFWLIISIRRRSWPPSRHYSGGVGGEDKRCSAGMRKDGGGGEARTGIRR